MGVDASFFAVKAKKYYYFDREYNVNVLDLSYGDDSAKYADAIVSLVNHKSCGYDRVIYVLTKNIEYWKTQPEPDSNRAFWNESLLKFVNMFPNDIYFIATDHEEPCYWDIAKKEGYSQFQFAEDIPAPPSCHCPKEWCPLHITIREREELDKNVIELQKALSVGDSLIVDNGCFELANLNGNTKKIKI